MAGQRRKQKSVLGTLVLEITTLAGILGIAQPTLREQLWSILSHPAQSATSTAAVPQFPASQYSSGYAPAPNYVHPNYNLAPTTYSAHMVPLPATTVNPATWGPSYGGNRY